MPETLKDQAIKGVFWTTIEKFGGYAVQFVIGIIIARILNPKDYGLIGMIMFFFAVANAIVEGGLGSALVQKKDINDEDVNTAFYLNLGLSIFVYITLWLCAPLIAIFFNEPSLTKLTRFVMINLLVNAFGIVQLAQMMRGIQFRKNALLTLIAASTSGVCGIVMALFNMGVWSLAVQMVFNRMIYVSGIWCTSTWRPKLLFRSRSAIELFHFAGWTLFDSVLAYSFSNIYQLVIGKLYSTEVLGFYSNSKKYVDIAKRQISGAIGMVAFPVLSKMQEDVVRMANGIRRFNENTMIFTVPLFITLYSIATPFVIIVLGEKWTPMIPYFKLLCFIGLLAPLVNINAKVLLALGKSKLLFSINMVINILRIVNILIVGRESVELLIIGELFITTIQVVMLTTSTKRYVEYGFWEQLMHIKSVFIGGIVAMVVTLALLAMMEARLLMHGIVGIICPSITFFIYNIIFNREHIVDLIKKLKGFLG